MAFGVRLFSFVEPPLLLAKEAFCLCCDPWLVDLTAAEFCGDMDVHGCHQVISDTVPEDIWMIGRGVCFQEAVRKFLYVFLEVIKINFIPESYGSSGGFLPVEAQ